ncbi:MAG: hypothetical protein A3J93_04620 [Candidatus Magasanikbacteria bacterium RIFOXYC2_FULL_42_28]|uniref:Bacterial spore germination immunoglobulin-like domain-containing protein n=1 Tax=Candidatus Magasanikbacteria bacterium RIFOXYC2_FULL_42_28 TaxID=1798704 RepID=A0A1F6NXC8_9BACT|nr:MAG: hypothetical protein A3J93_04620 [Candidatus Magasanikbacteria bacterium RIFOXYC2_FULL_42_28]
MENIKPKVWPIIVAAGVSAILITGAVYWYMKIQAGRTALAQNTAQAGTETAVDTTHADIIVVTTPMPNTVVTSSLLIEGRARGTWFFEASFPISIIDANGKFLGTHYGEAEGEWMTREFVPFHATLTFSTPTTERGTLILHNDNPSGLPENDDEIRIPVMFEKTMAVTIMVPENEKLYQKQMTEFAQVGGPDPLETTVFIKKEMTVPYSTDIINASVQAAAEEIPHGGGGGPDKTQIAYLKIQDTTAYVLLDIDLDGWAGVSVSIAIIHPLVEKTLLQFPEINRVEFGYAPSVTAALVPIDKNFKINNIGNGTNLGDVVMSVFPIYAFGCDTYGDKSGATLKYSKIDFFIVKDETNSPTVLLGTTPGGSAGSGECDLTAGESRFKSRLESGKYRIWAVRYIGDQPDKRTVDVKTIVGK